MAIVDLATFQTKLRKPIRQRRYKQMQGSAASAGPWLSTWKQTPDTGATPTTADSALSSSTVGALLGAVAASGTARLASIEGSAGMPGYMLLCDRLAHIGGLSGIVTTAQTVNIGPGLRATSGDGVWAAIEIYTQIGATATTATISYTNQAGTSGRTSPAIAVGANNSREPGRTLVFPLQEGDTGVQSVQSITLAATTGTAGNFGVTLFRPLVFFGTPTRGQNFLWNAILGGMGNMVDVTGICSFLLYHYSGTTPGDLAAEFCFVDA